MKESDMPAGIPKLFMLRKFKHNNKKYISKNVMRFTFLLIKKF
jgi:hypothetical protein